MNHLLVESRQEIFLSDVTLGTSVEMFEHVRQLEVSHLCVEILDHLVEFIFAHPGVGSILTCIFIEVELLVDIALYDEFLDSVYYLLSVDS